MTTITVHHKPADLLRLGFHAGLRSPSLKWALLVVAVVVLGINLRQQQSHLDPVSLVAIVLTTALFTAGALILTLALITLSTLLQNRTGSPAAEAQTYSVTEGGLARHSASSETLLKWGGARRLHKSKSAILVGVGRSSYFILPRHSFERTEEFDSFWHAIQRLAPDKSLERARER